MALKVEILRQRNPCHEEKTIEECRALYAGGKTWRAVVERFIPQHDVEPDDIYRKRLAAALYVAYAGSNADLLAALLFSEPPAIADAPDAWWDGWIENVDRAGTGLAWWARLAFVDALIGKRSWCWVNLPPAPVVEYPNVLEQEAAKAGPAGAYLVHLAPELVIDWGYDEAGNLAWVMVEDQIERRANVDAKRTRTYRWRYIDAKLIRTWEWTPTTEGATEPQPNDEAEERPEVAHQLGQLPVLELCLPEGLWALGKMHDPAIAHLRARNGLSWGLNRAAHPLLAINARDKKKVTIGAGYYIALGLDEKAGYVEPEGTSFELLAADVTRLREELFRVVHQMALAADPQAQASKQSGESKQSDWQALEIVLAAYSELVLDWLRKLVALVAAIRREQVGAMTVSGLAGWQAEDLDAWLGQAALAVDARTFSPKFRKVVAKREAARLLAEEPKDVIDAINAEIDAAKVVDDGDPYAPPPRPAPGAGGRPPPKGATK